MVSAYRFVPRPPHVAHGHPFLVYDSSGRLHFELTCFAKEATLQVSQKTTQVYLYALLPFFTWLETESHQLSRNRCWNELPEKVRSAVEDYLNQQMSCQLRQHHLGFQLVRATAQIPARVRMFLVALKFFYKLMKRQGFYKYPNPLVDSQSEILLAAVEEELKVTPEFPLMPSLSGVQEPINRQRLTDSYYKMVGQEWIPQIIDDLNLPRLILEAGCRLPGWGLREECVTRILFESGARISEVVGLTFADWVERGMKQETNAFSKGSSGRRIKFLRFSNQTAKLLRRYVNQERIKYDPNGYDLNDYLKLSKQNHNQLQIIPLFLTRQRTGLNAKNYRDNYWKKACELAGIKANVHQARHWYVTMAVRQIYETSKTESEVMRRLRELQEYMKWRSSQTVDAYEHYFDAARHAQIQNRIHAQMEKQLKQNLLQRQQREYQQHQSYPIEPLATIGQQLPEDPEFDYLCRLGGSQSER